MSNEVKPNGNVEARYRRLCMHAHTLSQSGMTHRQIAEAIGKRPDQIKSMLARGERYKEQSDV